MLIFFSILLLISWTIYVRLKLKAPTLKALIFKISTTFLIIVIALFNIINSPDQLSLGVLIVIGLILGLIGDIVLDLKLLYPKDDKFYTYFGFTSFIIGHLIYIGYFALNYHLHLLDYSFIFGFAGMSVFILLVSEDSMKLNFGEYRLISAVYAFVLSLVTFLLLWTSYRYGNYGMLIFGIGLILFLISDLILSFSYFGKDEKSWMIKGNYIFYYGAQYLIAASISYF